SAWRQACCSVPAVQAPVGVWGKARVRDRGIGPPGGAIDKRNRRLGNVDCHGGCHNQAKQQPCDDAECGATALRAKARRRTAVAALRDRAASTGLVHERHITSEKSWFI